jgi:phenylpyruvate tautomerase PptA (4-oxalocrotonate tautomerase family)
MVFVHVQLIKGQLTPQQKQDLGAKLIAGLITLLGGEVPAQLARAMR